MTGMTLHEEWGAWLDQTFPFKATSLIVEFGDIAGSKAIDSEPDPRGRSEAETRQIEGFSSAREFNASGEYPRALGGKVAYFLEEELFEARLNGGKIRLGHGVPQGKCR